jgi:hypothetical protein
MAKRKLLVATALVTGTLLACSEEAIGNPKGCWYDDGGYHGSDCEDAGATDAGATDAAVTDASTPADAEPADAEAADASASSNANN